jgi:hypothetical protein
MGDVEEFSLERSVSTGRSSISFEEFSRSFDNKPQAYPRAIKVSACRTLGQAMT